MRVRSNRCSFRLFDGTPKLRCMRAYQWGWLGLDDESSQFEHGELHKGVSHLGPAVNDVAGGR
jgi:hypothetical protein